MDKTQGNEPTYNIGKPLYDKDFENSNIWDMIIINKTQEKYGTGCVYIEKGTEIKDYGETKYNWIVDKNGEVIQLEEGEYTELSYGDELAVTEGLVFNVDSNNIDNNNLTTWGEGVSLHGFENNVTTTSKGLEFDGIDDYVEFKSTADYSKGFTLSFYGVIFDNEFKPFFSKQRENDVNYSCRFAFSENNFKVNTSKNKANSKWSQDKNENNANNGNLFIPCSYISGEIAYFDLTFDAENNEFKLYKNNEFIDSDVVDEGYWHGENGGQQIFEDDSIFCYLARGYGGSYDEWLYSKLTIYSLRLYNRPLNEEELKSNYDKTIAMHSVEE